MNDQQRDERNEQLTARTMKIINAHGRIVLKNAKGWYLGSWTNIAAGPDNASWTRAKNALEMFDLQWAFAIAPLYGCKVFVRYERKRRSQEIEQT